MPKPPPDYPKVCPAPNRCSTSSSPPTFPPASAEIAKAFGLKGQEKIKLKALLKDMAEEGLIDGRKSAFHRMGGVPKVTTLKIVAIEDGDLIAEPDNWDPEAPPAMRRASRSANRARKPRRQSVRPR